LKDCGDVETRCRRLTREGQGTAGFFFRIFLAVFSLGSPSGAQGAGRVATLLCCFPPELYSFPFSDVSLPTSVVRVYAGAPTTMGGRAVSRPLLL